MRNDDYNSAGFLILILIGLVLIVAALFLMNDVVRSDKSTQLADWQRPAAAISHADERT